MLRPAAPSHRLHAQRALLHPLWLGSLALLAMNDHWLKGAAIMPELVTGKLSDIAGMIVAPAVLATALRVETRRGWWLAHVAVGVVFTAIKLSPACAALWSALMGGFGFAWAIVVDPTDILVAIPALVLGGVALRSALATPAVRLARRSAEAGLAGVGLLCSVATSAPNPEPGTRFPEIFADVWLHNGTELPQVVRIRPLRPTVQLDCDAVATDPARLLPDVLFDAVQSWTVPPDANIAVLDPETEGDARCFAALVDADDFAPVVLFWRPSQLGQRWIPGTGFDGSSGGIELVLDEDGDGEYAGDDAVLFTRGEAVELGGECAVQDDADRVDWGDTVPQGQFRIAALVPGVDGCTAIDLADVEDEGSRRMYLCMPALLLPFGVDDDVVVRIEYGVQSESIVIATASVPEQRLVVSRGASAPVLDGLQVAVVPLHGCELAVDDCGTAARAANVTLGGGSFPTATIGVGDAPAVLEGETGTRITVAVAHAQVRALVDTECAAGPEGLGDDLELAAVIEQPGT